MEKEKENLQTAYDGKDINNTRPSEITMYTNDPDGNPIRIDMTEEEMKIRHDWF